MPVSNISPGGQIYDRTTGTWVGENVGTVGDGRGDERVATGRGSLVWHNADGPVGIQLAPVQQVAASSVATGPGGGGSGPGSAAVVTAPHGGGSGPGSPGVLQWQEAERIAGVPASLVHQFGLPPMEQALNPNVTQVSVGGTWWHSNPWFSDAEEYATRYGEGELAETAFFLTNVGADFAYNAYRFGNAYVSPWVNTSAAHANQWFDEAGRRVTAPIPEQEPVDWGR